LSLFTRHIQLDKSVAVGLTDGPTLAGSKHGFLYREMVKLSHYRLGAVGC
jgi:hypothetical protein